MGLQFGLGLNEDWAAVRQRRAINAAHFLPPAHCARKLVLSVSLPADIDINEQKPCDSTNAQVGKGVFFVHTGVI